LHYPGLVTITTPAAFVVLMMMEQHIDPNLIKYPNGSVSGFRIKKINQAV
jgi:hypothetical protein